MIYHKRTEIVLPDGALYGIASTQQPPPALTFEELLDQDIAGVFGSAIWRAQPEMEVMVMNPKFGATLIVEAHLERLKLRPGVVRLVRTGKSTATILEQHFQAAPHLPWPDVPWMRPMPLTVKT